MSLDKEISNESTNFDRANFERVLQLVSLAKREMPEGIYPVDDEDFFDLYFNGGGFLTKLNMPYCRRYFKHYLECFGQGFSCVTDWEIGVVESVNI